MERQERGAWTVFVLLSTVAAASGAHLDAAQFHDSAALGHSDAEQVAQSESALAGSSVLRHADSLVSRMGPAGSPETSALEWSHKDAEQFENPPMIPSHELQESEEGGSNADSHGDSSDELSVHAGTNEQNKAIYQSAAMDGEAQVASGSSDAVPSRPREESASIPPESSAFSFFSASPQPDPILPAEQASEGAREDSQSRAASEAEESVQLDHTPDVPSASKHLLIDDPLPTQERRPGADEEVGRGAGLVLGALAQIEVWEKAGGEIEDTRAEGSIATDHTRGLDERPQPYHHETDNEQQDVELHPDDGGSVERSTMVEPDIDLESLLGAKAAATGSSQTDRLPASDVDDTVKKEHGDYFNRPFPVLKRGASLHGWGVSLAAKERLSSLKGGVFVVCAFGERASGVSSLLNALVSLTRDPDDDQLRGFPVGTESGTSGLWGVLVDIAAAREAGRQRKGRASGIFEEALGSHPALAKSSAILFLDAQSVAVAGPVADSAWALAAALCVSQAAVFLGPDDNSFETFVSHVTVSAAFAKSIAGHALSSRLRLAEGGSSDAVSPTALKKSTFAHPFDTLTTPGESESKGLAPRSEVGEEGGAYEYFANRKTRGLLFQSAGEDGGGDLRATLSPWPRLLVIRKGFYPVDPGCPALRFLRNFFPRGVEHHTLPPPSAQPHLLADLSAAAMSELYHGYQEAVASLFRAVFSPPANPSASPPLYSGPIVLDTLQLVVKGSEDGVWHYPEVPTSWEAAVSEDGAAVKRKVTAWAIGVLRACAQATCSVRRANAETGKEDTLGFGAGFITATESLLSMRSPTGGQNQRADARRRLSPSTQGAMEFRGNVFYSPPSRGDDASAPRQQVVTSAPEPAPSQPPAPFVKITRHLLNASAPQVDRPTPVQRVPPLNGQPLTRDEFRQLVQLVADVADITYKRAQYGAVGHGSIADGVEGEYLSLETARVNAVRQLLQARRRAHEDAASASFLALKLPCADDEVEAALEEAERELTISLAAEFGQYDDPAVISDLEQEVDAVREHCRLTKAAASEENRKKRAELLGKVAEQTILRYEEEVRDTLLASGDAVRPNWLKDELAVLKGKAEVRWAHEFAPWESTEEGKRARISFSDELGAAERAVVAENEELTKKACDLAVQDVAGVFVEKTMDLLAQDVAMPGPMMRQRAKELIHETAAGFERDLVHLYDASPIVTKAREHLEALLIDPVEKVLVPLAQERWDSLLVRVFACAESAPLNSTHWRLSVSRPHVEKHLRLNAESCYRETAEGLPVSRALPRIKEWSEASELVQNLAWLDRPLVRRLRLFTMLCATLSLSLGILGRRPSSPFSPSPCRQQEAVGVAAGSESGASMPRTLRLRPFAQPARQQRSSSYDGDRTASLCQVQRQPVRNRMEFPRKRRGLRKRRPPGAAHTRQLVTELKRVCPRHTRRAGETPVV
ncbi:hypothetical protein DIPPA_14372 [Diplonema papillatum]|nr:hypothetical protein DIPPA_14372 [Diplonema papillatum]